MKNDLIFAIGDVHGHRELLQKLLEQIVAEIERIGAKTPKIVFLGDYIDRGPDSKGVLDLVLAGVPDVTCERMLGNHEEMMLNFLLEPDGSTFAHWFNNGGRETLTSYGVDWRDSGAEDVRDKMIEAMPPAQVEAFFGAVSAFKFLHEDDAAIFVHAGLDPAVDLSEQSIEQMLWIRKRFLESSRDWGKPVIHGHTPTQYGPELRSNRIGVDTYAYATGNLTAVVLDGGAPRFLVTAPQAEVHVLVDPDGEADVPWLDWAITRTIAAKPRQAVACLSDTQLEQVDARLSPHGIKVTAIRREALAQQIADTSSDLCRNLQAGKGNLLFANNGVHRDFQSEVDFNKDLAAGSRRLVT